MTSPTGKQRWSGAGLIVVSLVLAGLTVYLDTRKHPNVLANAIIQAIILVFSTYGAYVFAKASVQDAARELVRPHARSAFRRVRNIYNALIHMLALIEQQSATFMSLRNDGKPSTLDYEYVRMTMMMLEQIITEQANTVDDAVEDWRDLVPEEVQEIEERVRQIRKAGNAE